MERERLFPPNEIFSEPPSFKGLLGLLAVVLMSSVEGNTGILCLIQASSTSIISSTSSPSRPYFKVSKTLSNALSRILTQQKFPH